ncbi:MAG: sigma-54-dependent Fis family transcriptional regulator [Flavobacteriales bacterium]|nr:MAG: sigma-54-dependent Fis family transcriptional regulator [Flavobacteriales bacterium]
MEDSYFDAILLDINFSTGIDTNNEGANWLHRILDIEPDNSVIMMTTYNDVELAVKAVKEGAVDFILKPWDNSKLESTINAAVRLTKTRQEVRHLELKEKGLKSELKKAHQNIIGSSPVWMETLKKVRKAANTDANILITGETGVGKNLIAKELFRLSKHYNEVFVALNVETTTEKLFESEMFGHVKETMTHTDEECLGKFEVSNGGTLFLDEIAHISLPLQAQVLNVLQNKEIRRVGGQINKPVDIRLVCSTNTNLQDLVNKGLFNGELLNSINTIEIEVPALRHRKSDIPALADFFLKFYTKKHHKTGLKLTTSALKKLENYPWPGNVKELKYTIENAVILAEKDSITADNFIFNTTDDTPVSAFDTLEDMEKSMIVKALKTHNRNLTLVAKQLGITRQTLYNKLKKYSL